METADPGCHTAIHLHLVEPSAPARAAQPSTLERHAARLRSSGSELPSPITGVVFANELLDALPPHAVVMREDGLRERFVTLGAGGGFAEVEGPPSTPELAAYLSRVGAALEPGCRAEINLAAARWMEDVAARLARGFLIVIDYGHDAETLYSASHAGGTLATFARHTIDPAPDAWLREPGARDITAHVDLTGVRLAAERGGLEQLAALDQTYALIGLGAADRLGASTGDAVADLKRRLALKTLLVPGGLGSTHKMLVFGKAVGRPTLRVTSFRERLT
jgi:SAM-dependent MidA family methyltransferase